MDEKYMRIALELAASAAAAGEVPVGCVVTRGGEIVGKGRNRREEEKNALAHAEIEAIGEACRTLGGWRLFDCDLYCTLEPCPMCAGAILNARIRRVFFGASDPKGGAMGGVFSLFDEKLNHRPEIIEGVLSAECAAIITEFFSKLRNKQMQSGTKRL